MSHSKPIYQIHDHIGLTSLNDPNKGFHFTDSQDTRLNRSITPEWHAVLHTEVLEQKLTPCTKGLFYVYDFNMHV